MDARKNIFRLCVLVLAVVFVLSATGFADAGAVGLKHYITVIQSENGRISPNGAGSVTVVHNKDKVFKIKPDQGYYLESLTVDGSAVNISADQNYKGSGKTGKYTFRNVVSDDHSITATFAPEWALVDNVTVTYKYNAVAEQWEKAISSVKVPDPEGVLPKKSNTLIIRVNEDDPVKEIIIFETHVSHGNDPIFEINGRDTSDVLSTGKLHIGELILSKVDAKQLEIKDTKVVRQTFTNVVANDNEFDQDIQVENVVVVGRGTGSSLLIGLKRKDMEFFDLDDFDFSEFMPFKEETGVRVDRIRILGPSSGFGSIERLMVVRTSVFGKIQIKNTEIQDLILKDVSLDDNVP